MAALHFDLVEDAPDARTHVLAIHGDADMTTAMAFNERFFRAATAGKTAFVADLSAVSYLDSTMLNALLVGQRRMARAHGRFALVCQRRTVGRLLELAGVRELFEVFETRQAALAHLARAA